MARCPQCTKPVDEAQRFCGHCGAATDASATRTSFSQGDDAGPSVTSTSDGARFVPGTILAERYRIVGLLGRGGMGEVYRADDLKLGQPVALKFLPESLEAGSPRMQRLLNEVKLARQVSHPNVCRVYDIGELDGLPFISMEYVDGEDLASLLRRIGRLPEEKALQIGRQICAGLHAAHEQGILHRDLKPANVMIDGRGRVRLTDFGLAGLAEQIAANERGWGTPAYMAPEQFTGKPVTVQSDIYSLGLVLYELVTGKRAHEGRTATEIARSHTSSQLTSPSTHVSDLDPAIERVIERCLELAPERRPGNALAVAAALPGGDPLAAALAAGETPSPNMVANAGPDIGLSARQVLILFVLALVTIGGKTLITDRYALTRAVPTELSGAELAGRAREVLQAVGYDDLPRYHARGLRSQQQYLDRTASRVGDPDAWARLGDARPPAILFWARYSEDRMDPVNVHDFQVGPASPRVQSAGDLLVELDTMGRLYQLRALPTPRDEVVETGTDWSTVLERAGWNEAELVEIDPVYVPTVPTSERRAWKPAAGDAGDAGDELPVYIQAGMLSGRLTHFHVVEAWDIAHALDEGDPAETRAADRDPAAFIGGALIVSLLVTILWLARRNIKAGRSDVRGALRLFFFVVLLVEGSWLVLGVRLRSLDPMHLFVELVFGRALAHALLHAGVTFAVYIALEPYVRRLWPTTLVTWSRLLLGRFRDPLVGRDILIGFAVGGVIMNISLVFRPLAAALGQTPSAPYQNWFLTSMPGARSSLGGLMVVLEQILVGPMGLLVFLMLMRLLLRRNWAAVAALVAVFLVMFNVGLPAEMPVGVRLLLSTFVAALAATIASVLLRVGLVATIAMFFLLRLDEFPLTFDLTRWYADGSVLVLAVAIGLVTWAFWAALAGRSPFGEWSIDAES